LYNLKVENCLTYFEEVNPCKNMLSYIIDHNFLQCKQILINEFDWFAKNFVSENMLES